MSSTDNPNVSHNSEDSIDCFRDNLANNQCSDVSPEADSPILSPLNTLSITEHKVIASHDSRLIVSPNGRQYSSDSFDRFGDDLSELLLSYLCFKDKFRFECMSKQWQRLVFNKIIDIENVFSDKQLHRKYFTYNDFKKVLQKCHNMKKVKLYFNEETVSSLSLLSDNYHRLKSIKLSKVESEVSSQALTEFCQTFGSKVEEIDVWDQSNKTSLLNCCSNLKILSGNRSDWLCLLGNQLVTTLNTLSFVFIDWDQISAFGQLVDKYQNTMKKIWVYIFEGEEEDIVSEVFKQLSRLKNLESLRLAIQTYPNQELDLIPNIADLCGHCPKLSMINLDIAPGFMKSRRPSKSLMGLKKLNFQCHKMTENFFDIISDLAPNLKEFNFTLTANYGYSSKHLSDLSRMKHLKRLSLLLPLLEKGLHSTDDSAVIQLLDNCPKLLELKLDFPSNITVKTIHKLKELAIKRPKERIRFSTMLCGNESKAFCHSMNEIPNNLNLDLIN